MHMVLTTACNSSFKEPKALFRPPQALHACGARMHMQAKHSYTLNETKALKKEEEKKKE